MWERLLIILARGKSLPPSRELEYSTLAWEKNLPGTNTLAYSTAASRMKIFCDCHLALDVGVVDPVVAAVAMPGPLPVLASKLQKRFFLCHGRRNKIS